MRKRRATFDALIKQALLRVHGARCVYRGIAIDEKHASIDHVIPEGILNGDPTARAEVLTRFGIDPEAGFAPNGFLNLVLTDQQYNRKKWHYVDGEWEEVIRKGLRVARENAPALEEEYLYLRFEDETELLWGGLPGTARTKVNVARLYDRLTGESERSPVEEIRTESQVIVRRPEVTISAQLPTVEQPEGTACFILTRLELRGGTITFGHQEIVETLLPGFGSELSHDRRRFVHYTPDQGEVTLQLGNNRFPLTRIEAGELCDAIDRLAVHYLGAMRRLESRVFESLRFPPTSGGVVLGTTSFDTWAAVLRHAHDHPDSHEDAAGMSFQVEGGHAIVVACAMPNDPGRAARVRIRAVPVWDRFAWRSEPKMRVCWDAEPPPQVGRPGERGVRESHYRTGVRWSAERTDAWLRETLLPGLRPPPARWPFARNNPAPKLVLHGAVRRHRAEMIADGEEFTTPESAVAALDQMQRFFSSYDWRSVSREAQQGLYTFLLWALEHSGPGDAPARYVHFTLPIPHCPGPTVERVRGAIESLRPGIRVSANIVDYSLRCALKLAREAEWHVPPFEVLDRAEEYLCRLCEEYRDMEYLEGLSPDDH